LYGCSSGGGGKLGVLMIAIYVISVIIIHILILLWLLSFIAMLIINAAIRLAFVRSSQQVAPRDWIRTFWSLMVIVWLSSFVCIGVIRVAIEPLHRRYADEWSFGFMSKTPSPAPKWRDIQSDEVRRPYASGGKMKNHAVGRGEIGF
jgi:hypothetical protein